VQFPPMRHDWQHHNFGFWVVGSLEDNQRVTYTYTVSADVIRLLSV
jgi:anti-sigma factor RsiW